MLDFIILTLSFTMAILLAMGLTFVIMLHPKVVKWYMKQAWKYMNQIDEITEEIVS